MVLTFVADCLPSFCSNWFVWYVAPSIQVQAWHLLPGSPAVTKTTVEPLISCLDSWDDINIISTEDPKYNKTLLSLLSRCFRFRVLWNYVGFTSCLLHLAFKDLRVTQKKFNVSWHSMPSELLRRLVCGCQKVLRYLAPRLSAGCSMQIQLIYRDKQLLYNLSVSVYVT